MQMMVLNTTRKVISLIRDVLFIVFVVLLFISVVKAVTLVQSLEGFLPQDVLQMVGLGGNTGGGENSVQSGNSQVGGGGSGGDASLLQMLDALEQDVMNEKYSAALLKLSLLEKIAQKSEASSGDLAKITQMKQALKNKDKDGFFVIFTPIKQQIVAQGQSQNSGGVR